jgi:2-iminobutanoate/2-iminopropanoate deaminase
MDPMPASGARHFRAPVHGATSAEASASRRGFLFTGALAVIASRLFARCASTGEERPLIPMNSTTNERKKIATPSAPAAIGPYSQAIAAGGLVHCSGQIALDPKSGNLIAGDVGAQTERVLENLKAVLAAAGSDFSRVVKCTVYLKSIDDFGAMNAVYGRYFSGSEPPARATVEVARLPKGALVEIDCMALV